MPTSLLDLSNELLAHICSYAMIHEYAFERRRSSSNHSDGVVGDLLSRKLRQLLLPMRSCRRLYTIARHKFLESNIIVLDLNDIRMGACRLEYQPTVGQLLYTGNPDPLLARLVHVQIAMSVSDTRMKNSLSREAENLRELASLCRNLKTLHVFLKVDAWFANETDLDIQSTLRHQLSEAEIQFSEHAKAIVVLLRELHIKVITVALHEWMSNATNIDAREMQPGEVISSMLNTSATSRLGIKAGGRIFRIKSAGNRQADKTERTFKKSWGASDDICRTNTQET